MTEAHPDKSGNALSFGDTPVEGWVAAINLARARLRTYVPELARDLSSDVGTVALLALGAGGAVAAPLLLSLGVHSGSMPLMRLEHPTVAETSVLLGFAVLIVRTRIKEG